jgi:hypothetical protein
MVENSDGRMMASRGKKVTVIQDSETLPVQPQTTPAAYGYGYGNSDHNFTLQSVMEMQKSLGELTSTINALKTSVDGVKSKVENLVEWKSKIIGGAIVLGFVFTLLGFAITKLSDYVTIKSPEKTVALIPADIQQPPLLQASKANKK